MSSVNFRTSSLFHYTELNSLKFYKAYEMHLKHTLGDGNDGDTLQIELHNPESVSLIAPFINRINSHNANLNFFGYAKKYMGIGPGGKEQCNYEENEWRYIVRDEENAEGVKWKWSEEEYNEWRGNGRNKPAPSSALEQKKLIFSVSDITHIVVEYERQIPDMIEYIGKLTQIGGSNNQITDDEKMMLYSKIISLEKIKSDF